MKYLNEVSYKDCVGKIFKSLNSGAFKILKYNNSKNVEIQFLKTEYETAATLGNIRNGNVKDTYLPSVYGIGVFGAKYPSRVNGVKTKEYKLWHSMLVRCYSDTIKKKHLTYEGCEVSDNFKSYEYFYEWCNEQIGFGNKDWHLDKDLLVKGNKIYSEDSCVFIPQEVNTLLTKRTNSRGEYSIGVSWSKTSKAFVATVAKTKERLSIWGFLTLKSKPLTLTNKLKNLLLKNKLMSGNRKLMIELTKL